MTQREFAFWRPILTDGFRTGAKALKIGSPRREPKLVPVQ